MIRKCLFALCGVLLGISALSAPAFSAPVPWTAAGTTAVIDESSTGLYALTPPYLGFNANGTGTIFAYFNVTDTTATGAPGWTTLTLSSFDNAATPSQVSATLYRLDKCNGTTLQLCTVVSGNSPVNTCNVCTFSQAIDFNQYEYYIVAQLFRVSTAYQPKLFALRLQ